MLDAFVESEGEAEVVMFSGGEPTIHKHILDFIDLAQARPIRTVNLNTNGIRLATDRNFVAERETTTKVLREFADRGLLRLARGRITVLDPVRLNDAAG
ncbi:radical SAM protein [Streptomyces chiangmaiensis]